MILDFKIVFLYTVLERLPLISHFHDHLLCFFHSFYLYGVVLYCKICGYDIWPPATQLELVFVIFMDDLVSDIL